ncbi:hypothetical protein [Smaragdicoccus niigatensis]|uniref:hypothetical protein n=1 Tax=Smaragdicoccus niigatensis TaxID=359359 RepID=UPI0003722FE2|nr:hypothetical protein [Smaragdicoccus niigatensis]
MKLNPTGNWIAIVAVMALVALTGTTLTAAASGMHGLALGGVVGIVALIVLAASAIAITQWRDRAAQPATTSSVTHLPTFVSNTERQAA